MKTLISALADVAHTRATIPPSAFSPQRNVKVADDTIELQEPDA